MLRRLASFALGLCALLALQGCGVGRIVGPDPVSPDHKMVRTTQRKYTTERHEPSREDGGTDTGLGGGGGSAIPAESAADSLGVGQDDMD